MRQEKKFALSQKGFDGSRWCLGPGLLSDGRAIHWWSGSKGAGISWGEDLLLRVGGGGHLACTLAMVRFGDGD